MPRAIDPQGCRRPSFRPAQTLWGFVSWKAVPAGISSLTFEKFSFFKLFPHILLLCSDVCFSQRLYCRKEFLEREDKDGLCCESSPKLKIEELNVPLARELDEDDNPVN
ncbi:hypothetical protein AAY473_020104 [Plecturocebus cupreus]